MARSCEWERAYFCRIPTPLRTSSSLRAASTFSISTLIFSGECSFIRRAASFCWRASSFWRIFSCSRRAATDVSETRSPIRRVVLVDRNPDNPHRRVLLSLLEA